MTFKVYRDIKHEWRWRLIAKNGKIIADSGEGYKRHGKCYRMIEKMILNIHAAGIEEISNEKVPVITKRVRERNGKGM